MAWEHRPGCPPYYFRYLREGTKVHKVYCGIGDRGRQAEAEAVRCRADRQARRAALARSRREWAAFDRLARWYHEWCKLAASVVLLHAGFHRPHRNSWCRRSNEYRKTP
jgi:hypothetical protein